MKKYLIIIFILGAILGCEELERGVPVNDNDTAPLPVTNVQVANIPGGATLTYTLPISDNLLYVVAVYSTNSGVLQEKKSSFFSNSITLQGFPDTRDYKVTLYAVSRGGKKSAPAEVTISPQTPPVLAAYESLTMVPTFGGAKVSFENASEADLKMIVLTTDSLGELYVADTYYTKRQAGSFSVRGFAPLERKFGIFTLDRWNNKSDTLFVTLIPWYETKLNKGKFVEVHLAGDTWENHVTGSMKSLWDDVFDKVNQPVFHTKPNTGIPQSFTIDLKAKTRLSRFKFHHRYHSGNTSGQYMAGDPKIMEVYGSNNPASDGSWESWVLLGTMESVKPSSGSAITEEDVQFACVDGEDYEFENTDNAYRYLRFRVTKNWGGVTYIYIAELTFWGEVLELYD